MCPFPFCVRLVEILLSVIQLNTKGNDTQKHGDLEMLELQNYRTVSLSGET